jgi:5-bromo-4-chloroindolyl phosphate hydrolysis protein
MNIFDRILLFVLSVCVTLTFGMSLILFLLEFYIVATYFVGLSCFLQLLLVCHEIGRMTNIDYETRTNHGKDRKSSNDRWSV